MARQGETQLQTEARMRSYERVMEIARRQKMEDKFARLNLYLYLLMILDFILTYLGIHQAKVISEGNQIIAWTFELPFANSFAIRILYVFIVIGLSLYIYSAEFEYYNIFIHFALGVNVIVMLFHFRWIAAYLLQSP